MPFARRRAARWVLRSDSRRWSRRSVAIERLQLRGNRRFDRSPRIKRQQPGLAWNRARWPRCLWRGGLSLAIRLENGARGQSGRFALETLALGTATLSRGHSARARVMDCADRAREGPGGGSEAHRSEDREHRDEHLRARHQPSQATEREFPRAHERVLPRRRPLPRLQARGRGDISCSGHGHWTAQGRAHACRSAPVIQDDPRWWRGGPACSSARSSPRW